MYRASLRDKFGCHIRFRNAQYQPPSLTPGYFINTSGTITFQPNAGGTAEAVSAIKTFDLPTGVNEPDYPTGGSSTPFYKCATVTPAYEGGIVVSGAGSTVVNGTYTLTSGTGSSRIWEYGDYKIYWDGNGKWIIEETESASPYYTAEDTSGESDPWDLEWMDSAGDSPEPTLTEEPATEGSWTGYKAVLSNGVYTFENTATSGLTCDADVPEVGSVYAGDVSQQYVKLLSYTLTNTIPTTFTSDTSIEGYVCSASSEARGYEAYRAFNQAVTTSENCWYSGSQSISTSNPAWIKIQVPTAFIPIRIMVMNEIASPANFKDAVFQGSNDDSTWDDLYTITGNPDTAGYSKEYPINTSTAYQYFRLLVTESNTSIGVSLQAFRIDSASSTIGLVPVEFIR